MPARVHRARDLTALLSTAAEAQLAEVAHADSALREAVALYAAGGDRDAVGKPQRLRATTARARLDAQVDRIFFDHLWIRIATMEEGAAAQATAARAFKAALVEAAGAELAHAFGALPCPAIRAPRARVRAEGKLRGLLRHHRLIEEDAHA
jgi:hypothetical protein